ncbi:DRC10 protein, partial [Bucco capensis]|nr:DRC10 protein [Bucco capensis]
GIATPEKARMTLDVMKMLDPSQLKPDSIETERIMTVLDETVAKLKLSSLIPHIMSSLDSYADVLGPEITSSLIQHQKLSNEMEQLLASSGEEDTVQAEEQQGSLCLLEQHLKSSVRDILRLFQANPSLCQALKHQTWAREPPAEGFIKAFEEFRNFIIERLLTSPGEEEEKSQFMEDISLQITKTREAVTALQAELAAAIQAGEEEIQKKDNIIEDLKSSIRDLAKVSEADTQQIKEGEVKQQEEELEASQTRCARLQQDIEQLEAELSALIVEHRAAEAALRKRKCRAEMEIVNWIQKYDIDMAEKQAEYEEVRAACTEEKAELSWLLEKHELLLQEYSQLEEERRLRQQKEEEAERELKARTLASIRIQALWRGYVARASFRKMKQLREKRKGKGKKGKKSKK